MDRSILKPGSTWSLRYFMETTDLTLKAEISIYYDLYVPDDAGRAPLLIAVHGYGAHKRYMMREAKAVVPETFVIASVQGPHQHFRQTPDGYRIGFGSQHGAAALDSQPMRCPRIEVRGDMLLDELAHALEACR